MRVLIPKGMVCWLTPPSSVGRDGEAFLNLISVVPIRWKESSGEDKEYYVGFQVDVSLHNILFESNEELMMPGRRKLNEALGGAPSRDEVKLPEVRATVDYNEARGPGDETWTET